MRRTLALGLLAACSRTPDPNARTTASPPASPSASASASASAPASASAQLAGTPCADLPTHNVSYTDRHGTKRDARTHRAEGIDLDGKGLRLFLVPSADKWGTGGWAMFLGKDDCPEVGWYFGPSDPVPLGTKTSGLEDLETRRNADVFDRKQSRGTQFREGEPLVQRHHFDGKKYVGEPERRP